MRTTTSTTCSQKAAHLHNLQRFRAPGVGHTLELFGIDNRLFSKVYIKLLALEHGIRIGLRNGIQNTSPESDCVVCRNAAHKIMAPTEAVNFIGFPSITKWIVSISLCQRLC